MEAGVIGRRRDAVITHRAFRGRQRARLVAVGMRLSGVVRERRSTLGVTKQFGFSRHPSQ